MSKRPRILLLIGRGDAVCVALDLPRHFLAQLDDDPLGGPLADPRHGLEALRVTGGDRPQQLADGAARKGSEGDLRPHPADRDQQQKEVPLALAGEAVEVERVVAGDQVSVELGALATRRPPSGSRPRPRGGSRRRRPR